MLSATAFTARTGWARVADISRISDLLEEREVLLWATADARELSPADLAQISDEFGLHPLAVEDAMQPRERPKLESYPAHRFLVAHQLDLEDGRLEARQVACFVGERYVLVIHDGAHRVLDEARARLQRPREPSAELILHALVDAIVDEYASAADALEVEVERIEDAALADPSGETTELFSVRRRLARLRRYAAPMERLLDQVVAAATRSGSGATAAFRDVHDHTIRVNDALRSVGDIATAIFDLQRSEQARSLSEVTKRLSGWAAIIAVPTMIASIYGMNFALVPEEGTLAGFFVAVASMAASGIVLYVMMRRRRWI